MRNNDDNNFSPQTKYSKQVLIVSIILAALLSVFISISALWLWSNVSLPVLPERHPDSLLNKPLVEVNENVPSNNTAQESSPRKEVLPNRWHNDTIYYFTGTLFDAVDAITSSCLADGAFSTSYCVFDKGPHSSGEILFDTLLNVTERAVFHECDVSPSLPEKFFQARQTRSGVEISYQDKRSNDITDEGGCVTKITKKTRKYVELIPYELATGSNHHLLYNLYDIEVGDNLLGYEVAELVVERKILLFEGEVNKVNNLKTENQKLSRLVPGEYYERATAIWSGDTTIVGEFMLARSQGNPIPMLKQTGSVLPLPRLQVDNPDLFAIPIRMHAESANWFYELQDIIEAAGIKEGDSIKVTINGIVHEKNYCLLFNYKCAGGFTNEWARVVGIEKL